MLNRLKGSLVVLILSAMPAAAQQTSAAGPDQFVPMAPCRLLDTRIEPGASPSQEANRTIDVASTRCGRYVPAVATAYALRRTSHNRVEGNAPALPEAAQPLQRHNAGAPLHFPVAASEHIAIDLEGFYVPAGTPIDPFPAATSSGVVASGDTSIVAASASKLFVPRAESTPLTDIGSVTGPSGSLVLDGSTWSTVGFMATASSARPWMVMRSPDTGGVGGLGVFDLNGNELLRVASNGVVRLKNWATLSAITDYRESASIPNNTVHEVRIVNPRDSASGAASRVTFFDATTDDENGSPATTKFQASTLGFYGQQNINFDSQLHYHWPGVPFYHFRAYSATGGGPNADPSKDTFWVKANTDFDSLHATRADMYVSGRVGIGTTAPTVKLQVEDLNNNTELLVSAGDGSGAPHSPTMTLMRSDSNHAQLAKYGFTVDGDNKLKIQSGTTGAFTTTPLVIDSAGNATFAGNVSAGGVINAKYQDVAEWVPAGGTLQPGTVVTLNREKTNEVTPSTKAYDTAVAGVVSDQPGVLLGTAGADKAKIATTGRVKVRVDARTHPVKIGDLLVTSDVPGTAMLSEPLDLGGVKIHRPGTLIGKALEPLAGREGEILVLLSLQ